MHLAHRLALAAVLSFFAATAPAHAFTFVSSFGSTGSGAGQFKFLNQIALDPSGNVYAADGDNKRIEKFSPDGTFVGEIGAGAFATVYGLAVDASGSFIYATDGGTHNQVSEYTTSGGFVRSWGGTGSADGQLNGPAGIAVAPNGDVYVADEQNDRVQEFTPSGTFVRKWGSTGSGDGQFNGPDAVAVDSAGNVWVSEDQNNRIQEFTGTGGFIRRVTSIDGEPFGGAFALAFDSAGHLWVTDEKAVEELDSNGNFLAAYSAGAGASPFSELNGIAVNCRGVYTGDDSTDVIQLFSDATVPACPGSAPAPPVTPSPQPPVLTLAAAVLRSQRVLRQHSIVVEATADAASTISATAKAGALRFKPAKATFAGGVQVTLKLRLSRKPLAKLRSALRRHRALKAHVVVRARGLDGQVATTTRTVKLTR